MDLTFTNFRKPKSIDQLTPSEQAQLVVCGEHYEGGTETADNLVKNFFDLMVWDIVDEKDQSLKYRLYLYEVDSGTLFSGDTPEAIGDICQFGFEMEDYDEEKRVARILEDAREKGAEGLPGNIEFYDPEAYEDEDE